MALTKITRELLNTGIDDNSNATAITIDSSEDVTLAGHLSFADSKNAKFGAGSDLQIYHNGSHSYISDQGTGNLHILTNHLSVHNAADDAIIFHANEAGHVIMPNQPAFSATASYSNIPLASATTMTLSSERFDTSSDLSGNTFTAPVGGKYLFTYLFYFFNVAAAHTTLDVHIKTSNKQYQVTYSPDHFIDTDSSFSVTGSIIADMDANDTCYFSVYCAGGSAQTSLHVDSQVSGCLLT